MRCANHICNKDISADEAILCGLCLNETYCSEQCKTMDWVRHQCPNVVALPANAKIEKQTPFVAFLQQDSLPESELNQMTAINASILLYQKGTDKIVRERTVPSFVNSGLVEWSDSRKECVGSKPSAVGAFKITINDSTSLLGSSPSDLIWKGNPKTEQFVFSNKKKAAHVGRWLAQDEHDGQRFLQRVGERNVYWKSGKSLATLPLQGELKVALTTPDNQVIKLKGPYELTGEGLETIHAWDQKGNEAILQVQEGVVQDVKVITPTASANAKDFSAAPASREVEFSVDPHNPAHIVGLSMALEHLRAENGENHDENAAILRKHVCGLLYDGEEHKVDSDLNVAVYQSVNKLQQVEARPFANFKRWVKKNVREASDSRSLEKRLKTYETKEQFEEELDNLLAEAKNLQESKSTGEDKVILLETLRDYAKTHRLPNGKPVLLTPSKVAEIDTLRTNVKEIEGSKRGKAKLDRKKGKAAQKQAMKAK